MVDFFFFMFFSTIEGLAVYTLALYIHRMDFRRYYWHSILIILLINAQNYLTRYYNVEEAFAVAPLINLAITVLFFKTIVRVPLIWSMFMTLTGYAGFMLVQTAIVFGVFGGIEQLNAASETTKYLVQLATGLICIFLSRYIYKKGFGFTYDFERLRFWGEGIIVVALIALFIVGLAFMMLNQNLFVNLIGFFLGLLMLLYYSMRRENSHGI